MAKKDKARTLTDLKLDEISLVDKAANKRKFLFFKGADGDVAVPFEKGTLNIEIESDGTAEGTKVTVNDNALGKLTEFHFGFWTPMDGDSPGSISCSYTKVVATEDGFERTETFRLAKGDTMNKKIAELLKAYMGSDEDVVVKANKDSAGEVVAALELITKSYKKEFPEDLTKAVCVLAGYAGLGCAESIDKSAEVSELRKALADVTEQVKAIQAGKPVEKKEEGPTLTTLAKAITVMEKSLAEAIQNGVVAKKDDDPMAQIAKTLEDLTKRFEVVEKNTDGTSSLDSEEGSDGTPERMYKDADGKFIWKSVLEAGTKE